MADMPSRGLVLYGDGLMRSVAPSHTNLHSLASRASCGFLSLSDYPASENEDERIVREFAELLDTCESYLNVVEEDIAESDCKKMPTIPTIGQRFMGMRAAIITNNSCLQSFSKKLGLAVLPFNDLLKNIHPHAESLLDVVASEVLKLLGFQEGKTLETSQFDLVFMHIGAGEEVNGQIDKTIANNVEFVNDLVGKILHITLHGSEIASRLHFSVVMSYGEASENEDPSLMVSTNKDEKSSDLSLLFPRQSYSVKGGIQRTNVRHYCPMLSAQWQDAVTRTDMANTFSHNNFKEHGGNLTIPADRFLHEVAFKLWKAPKYGA